MSLLCNQLLKNSCRFLDELKSRKFKIKFSLNSLQNDVDDPERGMIFVCAATHKTKVGYVDVNFEANIAPTSASAL